MTRLDVYMAEQGVCESREQAQRLIMAGVVLVDGNKAQKASQKVEEGAQVTLEKPPPYVSRGGLKLEKGLPYFGIDPTGWTVADIGASTGGFTDCLLQNGAAKVYSVDVGYGQLHWKLRNDPRVVVMEKMNARYLEPTAFEITPQLAVMDVSFISIKHILLPLAAAIAPDAPIITLIKPQFEAPPAVLRKGVVRDPKAHEAVLTDMLAWFKENGFTLLGLTFSPITGPKGNIEFLAHIVKGAGISYEPDIPALVAQAHKETAGTQSL